jgi:hypothetical protein
LQRPASSGTTYQSLSQQPAPPLEAGDATQIFHVDLPQADTSDVDTARIERFGPLEAFGPPPDEVEPEPHDSHFLRRFRRIRSHAKQRRVPRWAVFALILGVAAVGAGLRFVPGSPFASKPDALAVPMPFRFAQITPQDLGTEGFLSWAYLDRRDGTIVGSENMAAPSDTGSMIKAWIGADYLRRAAESGENPPDGDLGDVQSMIRDNDEGATGRLVVKVGGATESIGRLVTMCQLSETKAVADSWRDTTISARDAVRMGGCLADGRAAGAQWTPVILDAMRQVRGEGDFGIRKAFPAGQRPMIAIANGWLLSDEDGTWHANCLAVSDNWVLAVLQRYPSHGDKNLDLAHLDAVCQNVVHKLTVSS